MLDLFVAVGGFFISLQTLLCSFLPIGSMRITAQPAVFDCGITLFDKTISTK